MKQLLLTLPWLAGFAACTPQPSAASPNQPSGSAPVAASFGLVASDLPDHIHGVYQARDASYWFATRGQGLYRLRGEGDTQELRQFTSEHGLAGDAVVSIKEDDAGNLFMFCEPGGVCRFNGKAFETLTPLDPSKSEWRLVPSDLWFPAGQDSGAVYRWDGASLHKLAFPPTEAGKAATLPRDQFPNAKYSPYDVYTIFNDRQGRLWFGTAILGACRYDGSSFLWTGEGENGSFGVRSIVEDKDGKFFFSNFVSRYAEETPPPDRPPQQARYRKEPGIATDADPYSTFVSSLRDKDGVLWIATLGGGVFRYDGTAWAHYPVTHEGKPMWVYQLSMDRQGYLWLGTQGHGVYRMDGESFKRFKVQ